MFSKHSPENILRTFDLQLSPEEESYLETLNIRSVSHYENYGDFSVLTDEVKTFIDSIGEDNSEKSKTIATLVGRLVKEVLNLTGQESAWVTMRAFSPIQLFSQPRWHADNYYYPPTGDQYKVAITLKGPSTLFYDASPEERKELEEIRGDREKLTKAIQPSKVISPEFGVGSIFMVGTNSAPIHSEPDINSERLFLSMIPGSKEQIETLYQKTPERVITSLLTPNGFYCYFVGPRFQGSYLISPYENTEIITFKISESLEPDWMDNISKLIKSHDSQICTEAISEQENILKVTFPYGAVITLNDISRYFIGRKFQSDSHEEICAALNEYSNTLSEIDASQEESRENKSQLMSAQHFKPASSFNFCPIVGKNTAGLFKPVQVKEREDKNVVVLDSRQHKSALSL